VRLSHKSQHPTPSTISPILHIFEVIRKLLSGTQPGYIYGLGNHAVTNHRLLQPTFISRGFHRLLFHCLLSQQANFYAPSAFILLTSTVFPSDLASGIIGDGIFPKSKVPLERAGSEEDMAGIILFLTSKAGAYISGNVLIVDGGRLSNLPATY
jgi:hypothetical protein